jgi:hypothetical protein
VGLDPEERALLLAAAGDAGLPPPTARRVVAFIERGVLPLDPLALAQRVRGLEQLLGSHGVGGEGGGDARSAALRLLGERDGASLLSVPPGRLARQVALLRRLLPEYRPEWLLAAAPRWAAHGPLVLAARLREVEGIFQQHLGAKFPRQRLASPRGAQWRWLFALSRRTKTVAALELNLL